MRFFLKSRFSIIDVLLWLVAFRFIDQEQWAWALITPILGGLVIGMLKAHYEIKD